MLIFCEMFTSPGFCFVITSNTWMFDSIVFVCEHSSGAAKEFPLQTMEERKVQHVTTVITDHDNKREGSGNNKDYILYMCRLFFTAFFLYVLTLKNIIVTYSYFISKHHPNRTQTHTTWDY